MDVLTVDKQGNYSETSSDGTLLGTYTFTLWQLDHSGNLSKVLVGPVGPFTFD